MFPGPGGQGGPGGPGGLGPDVGGSLIETLNAGMDLNVSNLPEPTFVEQIRDILNVLHANLNGGSWDREVNVTAEYKEHEDKIKEAIQTFRSLIGLYNDLNQKVVRLETALKTSAEKTQESLKSIHAFSVFLNSLNTPETPFPYPGLTPEKGLEPEPEPEDVEAAGAVGGAEEVGAEAVGGAEAVEETEDDILLRESRDIVEVQRNIVKVAESIESRDQTKVLKDAYLKELTILKLYQHTFFKEINGANIGNTCSLCLQRPVTKYLNPCGHTGCDECLQVMRSSDFTNKHCYLCRKRVDSYHPLYFC